jgi:hypothetical protein
MKLTPAMAKADFQYMGKHHQTIDDGQFPAQITEGNGQLVDSTLNNSHIEAAEKWKHIERPAKHHGETKSMKAETPWHALAAVRQEESSKRVPARK